MTNEVKSLNKTLNKPVTDGIQFYTDLNYSYLLFQMLLVDEPSWVLNFVLCTV